MTQNILIDTSIALEGGEELIAKLEKVAPVFVTDIVLQELDGKKGAEGSVGYNAREFFRKLGRDNGVEMFVLPPNNVKLEKTDTLRKMTLGVTPIYVIVRKPYKSRDINDSKIIEIAKDYNMKLVTLDMAQRVRAMSEGVDVEILKVEVRKRNMSKIIVENFLNISIIFLFFAFVANIGYNLSKPLQYMNIAQTVQVGFFLMLGIFTLVFIKYLLLNKSSTITESKRRRTKNAGTDWITEPTDNLLIGNTFHDSLND